MAALSALPLIACSGYDFWTHGRYAAPKSGFTMEVAGDGHVDFGEDTTSTYHGFVQICPTTPSGGRVSLMFPGGTAKPSWTVSALKSSGGDWTRAELERQLRAAGYLSLDPAELDEAVGVAGGALAGPKGITLPGQSHHLKVLSARFDRTLPTAPVAPAACPRGGTSP
ncbi:MAG: hypothetical protein KC766_03350 [Myxococcales bacterium]|nr:hypothetical protein [Myxococcales bacterium]